MPSSFRLSLTGAFALTLSSAAPMAAASAPVVETTGGAVSGVATATSISYRATP